MAITPEALAGRVQVNVPFPYLMAGYLEKFLAAGLQPEIGLDAFTLDHYLPAVLRRVARNFQRAGRRITLHAPFHDLLPGALDGKILAASRRRLRQAFRYLSIFRPAAIVCHLGYEDRFYQNDQDKWLARSAATWTELAREAAAHGVAVMLENVYETDPELFPRLLSRIKAPNVRLCLDTGHLHAFGGGDFSGWLRILAPHIGHLHLHDNRGDQDAHLALGQGSIPLASVLNTLAEQGRRPVVTLEPHQEGSLAPSLEYLSAIWPWD